MSFDFYDQLTHEMKKKYNHMLETQFLLTMCDECSFLETDENERNSLSSSFLFSIQKAKELWGMDSSYYPQGSVSANRHNYEVIKNYSGGDFPQTHEFNLLRQGVINFLRLRIDDSSPTKSWMLGSSYNTIHTTSGKEHRKYRTVEVSLRHTATGLWILLEEFQAEELNKSLENSINAFLNRAFEFTEKNDDWRNDLFKHLTIAAISKTCNAITTKLYKETVIVKKAKEAKSMALGLLYEEECCEHSLDGGIKWKMPDVKDQEIAVYEYFLDLFALCMIPENLDDKKTQSVVKTIIKNRVPSDHGYGIPIHPVITHGKQEDLLPDFGASAAVLYLLWLSLEQELGDEGWRSYCYENFHWLLGFCLSAFDKKQYYLLPYVENNSKILFLPRFQNESRREEKIYEYISKVKKEIYRELTEQNGKLQKNLESIACPQGLDHIVPLISMWEIPKFRKKPKKWATETNFGPYPDLTGQFAGGFIKSLLS